MTLIPPVLCGLVLTADTLRRVYAVGKTANDHFVAAVVAGCMGFYGLMWAGAPDGLWPFFLGGMLGIWGLFFSIHRDTEPPLWVRWGLAYPSQFAYAFALWGGLVWLIRAPIALLWGGDVLWPGLWLVIPLTLAALGFINCYLVGGRVRHLEVAGLPLRVVHLSDIHASALMHTRELGGMVDAVNGLEPDVVLITGDLLMPFSEAEHGYLIEALSRLEAPTYACPGNHDLPVLGRLKAGLAAAGIPLLVDERALLQTQGGVGVEIVGVNFHWRGAKDAFLEAVANVGEAAAGHYKILMAHDPRLGPWQPEGRFDLTLSGHVHGGQVAANMVGIPYSVLRPMGMRDQGFWPTPGGGVHYVHRGNWFTGLPPRMGVAAEIALLTPPDRPSQTTPGDALDTNAGRRR